MKSGVMAGDRRKMLLCRLVHSCNDMIAAIECFVRHPLVPGCVRIMLFVGVFPYPPILFAFGNLRGVFVPLRLFCLSE